MAAEMSTRGVEREHSRSGHGKSSPSVILITTVRMSYKRENLILKSVINSGKK